MPIFKKNKLMMLKECLIKQNRIYTSCFVVVVHNLNKVIYIQFLPLYYQFNLTGFRFANESLRMDDNEDNEKVVDEKPVRNILFCTLHFTCYEKPHPITLIIVLSFSKTCNMWKVKKTHTNCTVLCCTNHSQTCQCKL